MHAIHHARHVMDQVLMTACHVMMKDIIIDTALALYAHLHVRHAMMDIQVIALHAMMDIICLLNQHIMVLIVIARDAVHQIAPNAKFQMDKPFVLNA